MKKLEIVIVFLLSLFILGLSFYPIYYRYKTTPSDRVYVGTAYYTADYAGYVSNIEQGIKGRWTYTDKFTSEDFPQTFLYYPYLLIGHVASLFNINSYTAYHLSRFVFGAIYIFLIYWLIKIIFPADNFPGFLKRLIAFLFTIFSSSFPIIQNGEVLVPGLSRMIAEVQVTTRFVIQPHFQLGNIALIFCLILFIKYLEKKNNYLIFLSGITVFLTTIFRPSNMILFLAAVGAYLIYHFYLSYKETKTYKTINNKSELFSTIKFFIINAMLFIPPIFYLFYLKQTYPFLPYFLYDNQTGNPYSPWDFILLSGPVLILGMFSLTAFKQKIKDEKVIFLIFLILANLFLMFVLPVFYKINSIRFLQTPLFSVFSILSVYALFRFFHNIIVIIFIIFIMFIISLPSAWLDFQHEVHLYYDAYYIWPPKDYLPGLKYLEKNSQPNDVVLTYQSLSSLVPMLSGNTVYWGHTNETLDYAGKTQFVENFYKGIMKEEEAKNFLQKNKIKFVLVGREEKGLGKFEYSFLKKGFENNEITILNY